MSALFEQFDVWGAFWGTITIAFFSAIGALLLGTVLAVMRVGPVGVLRTAGAAYVNIVRNTPLTLLVFFFAVVVHYQLRLNLADSDSSTWITDEAYRWGIIAMAVYHAAFVCEAIRSGINTVPPGQAEAARAIGLNFGQSLREVVLPQAFRGAIAPLASALIALIKNTTVLAAVGVMQTSTFMNAAIESRADLSYLIFALCAGFFVLLTLPLGVGLTHLSQKLAVKR